MQRGFSNLTWQLRNNGSTVACLYYLWFPQWEKKNESTQKPERQKMKPVDSVSLCHDIIYK